MVLAQGQYTEKDYVASQFLHIRPRRVFAVIGILLICLAIWALWVSHSLILFGSLGYLVLWAIYIPFKAKRNFRQHKAMTEPVEIEVRDTGLFFKRKNGEGLLPWSYITKWRCNEQLTLLYPTNQLFHLVPSHFFSTPESYQKFHKILQEKLGNAT